MLVLLAVVFASIEVVSGEAKKPKFRPDRVIVIPRKGVENHALKEAHLRSGRRLLKKFPALGGIEVLQTAPGEKVEEAVIRLRQSGLFEVVEPDYKLRAHFEPDDPNFVSGIQWALRNTGQNGGVSGADISAVTGWNTMRYATSVVVAVIDSGIRLTHEDLAANVWVNADETPGDGRDNDGNGIIDDVHGMNAIYESGDVMDDNGHGTHVAGSVGAVGNNGKGIAGVAWGVQLMACKFLDALGDGDTSDAIQCIDYAREKGADIINCSFGGDQYSAALYTAVSSAREAGIIVVAAAGNSSRNIDLLPNYPASFDLDNVVSVCALNRYNGLDTGYSNYGAYSVDIAAPGGSIYSTWHLSDKSYNYSSGTSMAAPLVSGAFALLKARYPDESAPELISRMMEAADPVAGLAGKCVTGGRMNLAKALGGPLAAEFSVSAAAGAAPLSVTFTNLSFGEVEQYVWDFGDGTELVYEANPVHVFSEPGEHTVTLKLIGPNNASHSKQTVIKVARNYEFVSAPFAWMDISSGQQHSLTDDGFTAPVEIGYPFTFYGEEYSALHIAANGLIGFGTNGLAAEINETLPKSSVPNPLIAPYWDNLNPSTVGGVYSSTVGEAPNRKFVVSWVDVPRNSNGSRLTFQAVLEEGTQEVVFQYLEMQPGDIFPEEEGATVGLQNESGEIGTVYLMDGLPVPLQNEQAIRARLVDYSFMRVTPRAPEPFAHVATEPLQAQERTIVVRNAGTISLDWKATSTNDWLGVSPGTGRLEPGAEVMVSISLNSEAANLEVGSQPCGVLFENSTDGQGTVVLKSSLEIAPPEPVLVVLTNSPAAFTGGLGGPFTPEVWSCTISNAGNATLHWEVAGSQTWVLPPTDFPALPPGQSLEIEVALSDGATELSAGLHGAELQITNLDRGVGNTTLPVSVNVRSGLQSHTSGEVNSGTFKLSVEADPGSLQVIESSQDLSAWMPVYTNTVDDDGVFELWFPTGTRALEFFRVRELP